MLRRLLVLSIVLGAVWAAPAQAASWCGTPTSTDRTPDLLGGPNVHVVYAVPSDGADRFGLLAGAIQADVESVDRWWRGQDPARTPRFDLFPFPCGVQAQAALTVRIAGRGVVDSEEQGVHCTSTCRTEWDRGTDVALTAIPRPGLRFARWSSGCSGRQACAVTLDGAVGVRRSSGRPRSG